MFGSHDPCMYREVDHASDLQVEIRGRTPEELFHHAILTLYALLGLADDASRAALAHPPIPGEALALTFVGTDEEDLLVQLLGELLSVAVAERRRWIPREGSCRLSRDGQAVSLRVEGRWRRILREETRREREIKAVTYHEARIRKQGDGYTATVVMDL